MKKWCPSRKGKMTFLSFVCQCSCFGILMFISVQNLERWIRQTTKMGVFKLWKQKASSNVTPRGLFWVFSPGDFSFLYLIFFRPSRIIVVIIVSGTGAACFQTQAELWSTKKLKKLKFHTSGQFLVYINTWGFISWTDDRQRKSIASHRITLPASWQQLSFLEKCLAAQIENVNLLPILTKWQQNKNQRC